MPATTETDLPAVLRVLNLTPEEREAERFAAQVHLAELPDDTDIADLLEILNDLVYLEYGQGNYSEVIALRERALVVAKKAFGVEHRTTLEKILELAEGYQLTGEYDRADSFLNFAAPRLHECLGPDDPERNSLDLVTINSLVLAGRWRKAEGVSETYLDRCERVYGLHHPRTLLARNAAIGVRFDGGRPGPHAEDFRHVYHQLRDALGEDHIALLDCCIHLFNADWQEGNVEGARQWAERTRTLCERHLPTDHPRACNALWQESFLEEDQERAESLIREALALQERRLGRKHPETGMGVNQLANFLKGRGEWVEAERLYKRALHIQMDCRREHIHTVLFLGNLGNLYHERGKPQAAEHYYRQAVEVAENLDEETMVQANVTFGLADLLVSTGRSRDAATLYEWAAVIREGICGREHEKVAVSLLSAGMALTETDPRGAIRLLEDALQRLEVARGSLHPETIVARASLAFCYLSAKNWRGAEAHYRRVLRDCDEGQPPDDFRRDIQENNLGMALYDQGRYAEAERWFRAALAGMHQRGETGTPNVAMVVENLANALSAQTKHREARQYHATARGIRESLARRM